MNNLPDSHNSSQKQNSKSSFNCIQNSFPLISPLPPPNAYSISKLQGVMIIGGSDA